MGSSDIASQLDALLFGIRRSVRYHRARERFFDGLGMLVSGLGVLGGSTAIATLLAQLKSPMASLVASAVVTASSALGLVVGTSARARRHSDLARSFVDLERAIVLAREIGGDELASFEARRLEIEAGEPPILRTLDLLCHNELARSMGREDAVVEIPRKKKLLAHFV